jgi:dihydroxyacid dehydratase/phosphogluconate dehydratase
VDAHRVGKLARHDAPHAVRRRVDEPKERVDDLVDRAGIRRSPPVPDLFDYSLSEGRDIYALAEQCCAGMVRGMETVFYELLRQGIPMDADAPTVTGTTWAERLADERGLPAAGVRDRAILLSTPRRLVSGVEVLESNFFETAVVKVSGMTDEQLAQFDDQIDFVLFFENEEQANAGLLDVHVLDRLKGHPAITREKLLAMAAHNGRDRETLLASLRDLDRETLFARMVAEELLKVVVVISGQGPRAFGMPEMFTPMRHINANRALHRIAALISDGRYSGTTWGAAIGHVTPEAMNGGWIGLLETGDLLHVQLTQRRIDLLDPRAFERRVRTPWSVDLGALRAELGAQRCQRIAARRTLIAATNRMVAVTDASRGVVPEAVAAEAMEAYTGHA